MKVLGLAYISVITRSFTRREFMLCNYLFLTKEHTNSVFLNTEIYSPVRQILHRFLLRKWKQILYEKYINEMNVSDTLRKENLRYLNLNRTFMVTSSATHHNFCVLMDNFNYRSWQICNVRISLYVSTYKKVTFQLTFLQTNSKFIFLYYRIIRNKQRR